MHARSTLSLLLVFFLIIHGFAPAQEPVLFSGVVNQQGAGAPVFTRDGKTVYLTVNRPAHDRSPEHWVIAESHLPAAGHLISVDQPEAYREAIRSFLLDETARTPSNAALEPVLFGGGAVKGSSPTFSPDGNTVYTHLYDGTNRKHTIYVSHFRDGRWTPSVVAPFSGTHDEMEPAFSADGSRLLFAAHRPTEGKRISMQIWAMDKTGSGWSEPRILPEPITTPPARCGVPSLAADGSLYFGKTSGGGWPWEIFYSRFENGAYAEPINLNDAINPGGRSWSHSIAPDQSFLIFAGVVDAKTPRADSLGDIDLYVSFNENGHWLLARNLGSKVNTKEAEVWPRISRDGRHLFFNRQGPDARGIYQVDLAPLLAPLRDVTVAEQTGIWTKLADMPTARLAAGAAAFNGRLYVIGGCIVKDGEAVPVAAVEEYSPSTGTWKARAPMPTPRSDFGIVVAGNRIFVIGGTESDSRASTDVVEIYDPIADRWTTGARMPTQRSQVGAALLGDQIYAVGGNAGHEHTFERYDPASNRWTALPTLPTPRRHAAIVALSGKLYAFGGVGPDGAIPVNTLDIFDPATGSWKAGQPARLARTDFAAVALGDAITAVGGFNRGARSAVESYLPATDTWHPEASLPASTHFHAAAALDGKIYVAGGTTRLPKATSAVYAFKPNHAGRTTADNSAVPVRYWELPTGSRIAYVHVPAANAANAPAIVMVHGGPGACQVFGYNIGAAWYQRLAQSGFHVYLYDQIGSGYSSRLSDPRQYTLERHVADLEAIRQTIGSERLILIGESHGATLSAHYIAAHPSRVEKAIFVSPGLLDPAARKAEVFPYPTLRVAPEYYAWAAVTRGPQTVARLRQLDAAIRKDVVAAHALVGDAEMDSLFEAYVRDRILRTCVHDPSQLGGFSIPGMGWWASTMTTWDGVSRSTDIRKRVAKWTQPLLILRGDSDYLPARVAEDYVASFPSAKLVRIPAAGHFIWMDQPERYCDEIEAFLLIAPRRSGIPTRR